MAKKILLIEDSAFERKAIMNMLKKNGYSDFVEAEDGETGLTKAKSEKPDLVLLDLRLPGMDGLECFKELKKAVPGIKVIVVTIVTRQESVDEATKLGAKAYIMKPITEAKLVPEVKRVIGGGSAVAAPAKPAKPAVPTAPAKPAVKPAAPALAKPAVKPIIKKPIVKKPAVK